MLYCESCRFFFLEPAKDYYFLVDDNGKQERYHVSRNSFASTAMQTGQPEVILNAGKDLRAKSFENPKRVQLWNIFCHPVVSNNQNNQVVAVIEMVNSLKLDGFSSKDKKLLEICSVKARLIFPVVRDLLNEANPSQENEMIYADKVLNLSNEMDDEQKKLLGVKMKDSTMDSKTERRSIIKQVYSEAAASKKRQPVLKKKMSKSELNWKEFDKIFNN